MVELDCSTMGRGLFLCNGKKLDSVKEDLPVSLLVVPFLNVKRTFLILQSSQHSVILVIYLLLLLRVTVTCFTFYLVKFPVVATKGVDVA